MFYKKISSGVTIFVLTLFLSASAFSNQSQNKQPGSAPSPLLGTNVNPAVVRLIGAASDKGVGTQNNPIVVELKKAVETDEHAREKQKFTTSDQIAIIQSLIFLLQLLAFVIQARFMRGTVSEMKRSYTLSNAEFIASHRPKIQVRALVLSSPLSVGEKVNIEFSMINAGDTHAEVVGISTNIRVYNTDFRRANPMFSNEENVNIPLEGGMANRYTAVSAWDLDFQSMINIQQQNAYLYCIGFVVYKDANGTIRSMGFLRRLDAATSEFLAVKNDDYEYSY